MHLNQLRIDPVQQIYLFLFTINNYIFIVLFMEDATLAGAQEE